MWNNKTEKLNCIVSFDEPKLSLLNQTIQGGFLSTPYDLRKV